MLSRMASSASLARSSISTSRKRLLQGRFSRPPPGESYQPLQKIANEVECIDGIDSITVEIPSVKLALSIHQRYYMQRMNELDGSEDPHAYLPTNVLTEEELCRVQHVILTTATLNWKDLSLSWFTCDLRVNIHAMELH
jgi:hypothetical protein